MSEPIRLPAPEKRKDKINKNDMRYLLKVQRGKQRTTRRAALDEEIKQEKKTNEKRRRVSSGNVRELAAPFQPPGAMWAAPFSIANIAVALVSVCNLFCRFAMFSKHCRARAMARGLKGDAQRPP